MYGKSESEQMLGPGEMLPGREPSRFSWSERFCSGTDLPRLSCPVLDLVCDDWFGWLLCSEPIVDYSKILIGKNCLGQKTIYGK